MSDLELEESESLVNLDKLSELVTAYKIPLIFLVLAILLAGTAGFIWQSTKTTDKVIFTQDSKEASSSTQIKADIEGAIVHPGVYQLPSSSRIEDLLVLSGGLSASADRQWLSKNVNLAAKLIDGSKVYIPSTYEVGKTNVAGASGMVAAASVQGSINLNSASASELDMLSGVGPVTAQKIIDGRPYQTIDELLSRKIVGKAVFDKIKDKITVY